jgi:hypothetical protein
MSASAIEKLIANSIHAAFIKYPKHPQRASDVLQRGLSLIVECSINTVSDLTISVVGDTYTVFIGQSPRARAQAPRRVSCWDHPLCG